jgi:hypothetical protein
MVCQLCHKIDGTMKTARDVSRSSGLLRVEGSRVRISQSDLKTGEGVVQMVHVTLS